MIATYYHPNNLATGHAPGHVRYCAMHGHMGETVTMTYHGRAVRYVVLDHCPRTGVIDLPAREFRARFGRKAMHAGRIPVRVRFEHRRPKRRHHPHRG
ncbi:MAG: hypothetical protein P4L33_09720 [Capsulimonadaceae bacterium]|nr:hypothetical protein [Capsulimonadaceae bacterium]